MPRKAATRGSSGARPEGIATVGVAVFSRPYRSAMLALLQREPGLIPADLGAGGEESEHQLEHLRPDVLLIDLPRSRMLPFVRSARRSMPGLAIVTVNCEETEEALLPLFEAGISGFVPSEASESEVLATIRAALKGEIYCPPRIVAALIRRIQSAERLGGARPIGHPLTPRETQVARHLEQGLSNKEIAARLGIEVSTAKNHVHSILQKLAAHRRGEAAQQLRGDDGPGLRIVRGRKRGRSEAGPE